jgi:hypothetical protein
MALILRLRGWSPFVHNTNSQVLQPAIDGSTNFKQRGRPPKKLSTSTNMINRAKIEEEHAEYFD